MNWYSLYLNCLFSLVFLYQPALLSAKPPVPRELRPWLTPQNWVRDTEGPVITLGKTGEFDDTHLFAPCVSFESNRYSLWYSGSQGSVKNRVFQLGLATSSDGIHFQKTAVNPVFQLGDNRHSILTPTLLRSPVGQTLREDGQLRMWFSSTDFQDQTGLHELNESTSVD
ncbi:MAG: hypothetical protein KDA70_18180, partial [Planctomycetaceae bacterium]|nr:hypothetical protein [Planctomycetaceae bacterium]